MTMLWTLPRQWAPNFVVAVQSHPRYLIETWLYCIVAAVVLVALLIRKHSSGPLGFCASFDVRHGTAPVDLPQGPQEVADDDVDRLSAAGEDAGAGDGAGADARHWPREVSATPPDRAADPGVVACAACRRARGLLEDMEDVDVDVDEDVNDDEDIFELSVDGSAPSLEGDPACDAEVGAAEDVGVDPDPGTLRELDAAEDVVAMSCPYQRPPSSGPPPPSPRGSMAEYVSTRYQCLRKAALAGQLLAVDATAAAQALLSEKDLVAVLSHAVHPRRVAARRPGDGPQSMK